MNCQTTCMTDIGDLGAVDSSESWVREVLEPDQLTTTKIHYGRRMLSRGELVLLWGLRFYVVFMVVIVGLAVWNGLHAAG